MVNSAVLEAREASVVQPSIAAAPAPIEATEGSAESAPAPQRDAKEAVEDEQAIPAPAQADAAIRVPPDKKREERQEAGTASPAGGVTVRGEEPAAQQPQSAPAAASPGAVQDYARYVSQALAKSRPRGLGELGTVQIRLVILPSGGLASVEIAKSSGNRRLDDMAVTAVGQARLPPPPPGMTASQRTYEVPYHFR